MTGEPSSGSLKKEFMSQSSHSEKILVLRSVRGECSVQHGKLLGKLLRGSSLAGQ
jgi:hypothetical protein